MVQTFSPGWEQVYKKKKIDVLRFSYHWYSVTIDPCRDNRLLDVVKKSLSWLSVEKKVITKQDSFGPEWHTYNMFCLSGAALQWDDHTKIHLPWVQSENIYFMVGGDQHPQQLHSCTSWFISLSCIWPQRQSYPKISRIPTSKMLGNLRDFFF